MVCIPCTTFTTTPTLSCSVYREDGSAAACVPRRRISKMCSEMIEVSTCAGKDKYSLEGHNWSPDCGRVVMSFRGRRGGRIADDGKRTIISDPYPPLMSFVLMKN